MTGERGLILPVVLLALTATAMLVAGMGWAALMEARGGRAAVRLVQARSAAETGAYRLLAEVSDSVARTLPAGEEVFRLGDLAGAGRYRATLRALGGGLFAIRAAGEGPGGVGRQTVVLLAARDPADDTAAAPTGLSPLPTRNWAWRW